ncbi:MAG: hypothetical protein ABI837_00760 [Acidobacteriota bacterium]
MIAQHYDEERIIAFLGSASPASDPHLGSCHRCSAALEEYRTIAASLGDDDVWHEFGAGRDIPSLSTIGVLRNASSQMEREDVQANGFLVSMLAAPREWWANQLRCHPGRRTAGMVRALVAASDRAIDAMPPDAVELGALAVEIADELEPASYLPDEVLRLRGVSSRQYAFALFFVGQFPQARAVISKGRAALEQCAISEYDLARLNIVASMNARALDRPEEALELARSSRVALERSGDRERAASAAMTESAALFKAGRSKDSLAVLLPMSSELDVLASDTQGRLLANIGLAYRELNDFERSLHYYNLAIQALSESSAAGTEILRVEWNIISVLLMAGRRREAEPRLVEVIGRFERYGMAAEAALAGLDLAEILLGDEKYAGVEDICRRALAYYENAGVSYGRAAQTALAYLQEAAHNHKVTPTVVHHVRTYLSRLPQQPSLMFAAPPG